jgi:hypothetical protein
LAKVMRSGDAAPSAEVLADVAKRYVNLNLKWWLTGEEQPTVDQGDRLLTQEDLARGIHRIPNPEFAENDRPTDRPTSRKGVGSVRFDLSEPEKKYVPMPVISNREDEGRIIMLDSRVAAGFPGHAGDPEFLQEQPVMHLPGFRYKGQGLIALQVSGDSMAPTIKHLDWLVARPLLEPDKEVVEGYVHILVTRDGCVAKRLFRAPRGRHAFICKSDNVAYPQYEQPVDGDERIYMALAILSEDLSNRANNVDLRLTALERDMLALQSQFNKR